MQQMPKANKNHLTGTSAGTALLVKARMLRKPNAEKATEAKPGPEWAQTRMSIIGKLTGQGNKART